MKFINDKLIMFLILISSILIYYFTHINPIVYTPYLMVLLFMLVAIFFPYGGYKFFLFLIVSYDEFSRTYLTESASFSSIFVAPGLGGSLFLNLAVVVITTLAIANVNYIMTLKISGSYFIKIMIILCIIGAWLGIANILDNPRMFISDLSFFVTIILGFYWTSKVIDGRPERLIGLIDFLLVCLISKISAVLFGFLFWSEGLVTIKTGSDAYLISMIPLLYYARSKIKGEGVFNAKFIYLFILLIPFLLVTASRGKLIVFLLSLLAIFWLERNIRAIALAAIISVLSIVSVTYVDGSYLNYFMWKVTSFYSESSGLGESTEVRVVSLYNILHELYYSVYGMIIGKGFASYFTSEAYPFPFALDEHAFNLQWIEQDKFYKPHTTIMYLFLKVGVVSTIIIFTSILMDYGKFKGRKSVVLAYKAIILLLPILMLINFTSKLQFLTGFVSALSWVLLTIERRKECESHRC